MLKAIKRELTLQRHYLSDEQIETIYLGGGTPSILNSTELQEIFNTLKTNFPIESDAEVTLEANPDDLTEQKLQDLYVLGVNRLSIGIQSFNNDVLKFFNRSHDSEAAVNSIFSARKVGFKNISLDLIYAVPNQDDQQWLANIEKALSLDPEHISSYSLTIESKTVFGNWLTKGKLVAIDDDVAARQLQILIYKLSEAGYEQYEISNFSKPGFKSQHNSSYWKQKKYLGIGPSAHSYNGITRQANISNNSLYIKSLNDNKVPYTLDVLTKEDHINEYLLTTLRTSWGADLLRLKKEFNYDLIKIHRDYIDDLVKYGHARIQNDHLTLTKSGILLADKISSDLFAEA